MNEVTEERLEKYFKVTGEAISKVKFKTPKNVDFIKVAEDFLAVAQAGAAAAEALCMVDKGYVEIEPNTAWINADECSGCKTCIPLCPFRAISRDEQRKVAVINEALCKGCGTCVGACPSGAAQQNLFTNEQIYEEIEGVLSYV